MSIVGCNFFAVGKGCCRVAVSDVVLREPQRIVKDFIVNTPLCSVMLDMGMGKTLTTLMALGEVQPRGNVLVIAPLNIAKLTWGPEIDKWGLPIRYRSLIMDEKFRKLSRKKRRERYEEVYSEASTMYFINTDLVPDLIEFCAQKHKSDSSLPVWPFPTVVIDESQAFKNPSSVRFKTFRKIVPFVTRMVLLSGTPATNSLLDLWSQMYLLDRGASLGGTFGQFRSRYFVSERMINNVPVGWHIRSKAHEQMIHDRINHLSISMENTRVNFPEQIIDDVVIPAPSKVMKAYRELKSELCLSLVDEASGEVVVTAQSAAIVRNKLLQIASGFVYEDVEEGEVPARGEREFVAVHEEKLKILFDIISSTPSPVLVAYRFQASREMIVDYLSARKVKVEVFSGDADMMRRWNEGEIPVMLLQPASAGHGLNLQFGGHTLVWFTLPDSLEHYLQTNARLARPGQKYPVQVYRLLLNGTIDVNQPDLLMAKGRMLDKLVAAVKAELVSG